MALITKGKPTNAVAISKQRVVINLITDALFQLSQTSIHPPASSQIFKFGPYQPLLLFATIRGCRIGAPKHLQFSRKASNDTMKLKSAALSVLFLLCLRFQSLQLL